MLIIKSADLIHYLRGDEVSELNNYNRHHYLFWVVEDFFTDDGVVFSLGLA